MLQIDYAPYSPTFTSAIPSAITITTDADTAIEVTVEIEGATAFSLTLYPYNGKAVFHDLRSIIEHRLIADSRPYVRAVLFAQQGTDITNAPEAVFLYSRLTLNETAQGFTQTHFLTTARSYLLPRSATQTLALFACIDFTLEVYTDCVVRPLGGGMPQTVRISEGTQSFTACDIHLVTVSPQTLQEKVQSLGTLLAFTVHRGFCTKTFYLTDAAPDITLTLLNEFLVTEHVHLHAVTKTKLALDRSTATSQGTLSFYDDTSADEYETETAMLTPYDARRLSRLLLSPSIAISYDALSESRPSSLLTRPSNPIPILITDLTADISDAHNATNTVKFKWKYRTPQFPDD